MEVYCFMPLDHPEGLNLFHQVAAAVYAEDDIWVPQSEGLFERLLANSTAAEVADTAAAEVNVIQVQAAICLEAGQPLARAAAIYHPRAAPQGYIGFFEALPGANSAARMVFAHCEQILRQWGAETVQAPRADNQLMGLLVKGFDLPQSIFTPHNPPYYLSMFQAAGYQQVERLCAYHFTRDSVKPLQEALSFLPPGIRTRAFDRRQLEREVQALNTLQAHIFRSHAGYVPRSLEEDRRMVESFLPLLDDELVIFAENSSAEPVGLLICLPDIYQAYKGKVVTAARLISIGVLPGWRHKGCGAQMAAHLTRNLLQKGYQSLEASWIKSTNHLPQNLARRFGGTPGREFALFQKKLPGSSA